MKTLELRNGDLVLAAGGYSMLSGPQKVIQDLGIMVREPLGADRFHPRWGTILDDFIGRAINEESEMRVRAELQRLIQNYVVMQTRQIQADHDANRRPRFRPGEIVTGVAGIDIQQRYDRLNVKVRLDTASGEQVTILRSVGI